MDYCSAVGWHGPQSALYLYLCICIVFVFYLYLYCQVIFLVISKSFSWLIALLLAGMALGLRCASS